MINKVTSGNYNQSFGHNKRTDMSRKQKAVVLVSSALAMTPVIAVLAYKKGFSLSPKKIFHTPVKDWALFKYSPRNKSIVFEAPQIISVATASVIGGFIGGALVDDKSHLKAKKREVLNQILGNVLVPVGCVWAGAETYGKYANRLEQKMFQFKQQNTIAKFVNKCIRKFPQAAGTLGFLSLGIFCGNKVSNLINEKLYHKKVDRNIRATDFAPHLDDLCMATTMMNKNSLFGSKLARLIPVALLVPGFQTGIAQEGK